MNRKGYYLLITALAFTGLALAFLLFPYYQQLALMLFYDQQYQKAMVRYLDLYDSGERGAEVVAPLIVLEQKEAKDDIAVKLAQDYLVKYPNSMDARLLLGSLLKAESRNYAYAENLLEITHLRPSLENWRELLALFEMLQMPEEYFEVLTEIVRWPGAKSQEYTTLAYLYATQGNTQKALETLASMTTFLPMDQLYLVDIQFAARFLIDQGELEEGLQLVERFVSLHPIPSVIEDLAGLMLDEQQIDEGLALLDLVPEDQRLATRYVSVRLGLLTSDDRYKRAAQEEMLALYEMNKLPQEFYPSLLGWAIGDRDPILIVVLIRHLFPYQLDFVTAFQILKLSLDLNEPSLAQALSTQLGPKFFQTYPTLGLGMELTETLGDEETVQQKLANSYSTLSDVNRVVLAELYAAKGFFKSAEQLLQPVKSWQGVDKELLIDLALLYIQFHFTQGRQMVDQLHADTKQTAAQLALVRLLFDTAEDKVQKVMSQVEQDPKMPLTKLQLLTEVAYQQKHAALALSLARVLQERYPSFPHQAMLGKALVLHGDLEQGLTILRKLYMRDPDTASQYLVGLITALKTADYRVELDQLINQILSRGTWSNYKWREVTFSLIEAGLKPEAAEILLKLSEGKGFSDPDVQTLLQLWGDKPDSRAIAWITTHARHAQGKEKGLWLKELVDVNQSKIVVELITPADLQDDAIAEIYVKALVALRDRERLEDYIEEVFVNEERIPRLKALAKAAKELDLKDIAECLYVKLLELSPSDRTWLFKELGAITFAKGDLGASRWYLESYLEESDGDYLSNYYYAEILWQDGAKTLALEFYCKALAQISDPIMEKSGTVAKENQIEPQQNQDQTRQLVEAHILYRLDYLCDARAIYLELMEKTPWEISLRVAYAGFLMDIGCYSAACGVLWGEIPPNPKPGEEDPYSEELHQVELLVAQERYLRERRYLSEALQLSLCGTASYPLQANLWAARGDIDLLIGRWRNARRYYEAAHRLQPDNESFVKSLVAIRDDHPEFIDLGTENRLTTPAQHERFLRFESQWYLTPDIRLLLNLERDIMTLNAYTLFNSGLSVPFDGVRDRGYVGLLWEGNTGADVIGKLFAGDHVIGLGGEVTDVDLWGRWTLFGEWRKPNWDITESTIEHGTLNRIGLSRRQIFSPLFDVFGSAAYQRYYLETSHWVASSWELQVLASYRLSPHSPLMKRLPEGSIISYNYLLDMEKVLALLTKQGVEGKFNPLPLDNRASNTGFLGVTLNFNPYFVLDGTAGYSYDLFGKVGGPIGSVGCLLGRKGSAQARINFSHYVSSQSTLDTVDSVVFDIKFPF